MASWLAGKNKNIDSNEENQIRKKCQKMSSCTK